MYANHVCMYVMWVCLYSICLCVYVLYIDLRPSETCHSKVIHRKKVTHSDGSYGKKSRRRAWVTIWDKVKSHGTVIVWCTKREWPVNCMTVISVWWRSNMPFQRLSGRLNYYITRWRQEVSEFGDRKVWRPDPLVTRCSRESQHSAENWAPGLWLSTLENGKERLMAIRVWVNVLQFCSVSNSLSHTQPFQIKWEVYSLKKSSLVFIIAPSLPCRHYHCVVVFCMNLDMTIQHMQCILCKYLSIYTCRHLINNFKSPRKNTAYVE